MDSASPAPPSGTVTFLFTDVEGSTRMWAEDADAMAASLRLHDEIMRSAIRQHGGHIFTTAGDSFCVAFGRASEGVQAAQDAQRRLAEATWPGPTLRVRMGLHLGEADERGGDYFGPTVNLAARLESAGHGGQILISELVRQAARVDGRDLGLVRLRDVPDHVRVFQVGTTDFPPLRVTAPTSTNLPTARTELIGRADEVRTVRVALQSSRVVTLVAGGGTGKTRLAIEVGEEELAHRPDGVWFVDLTASRDPEQLESAIAHGMEMTPSAGDVLGQILTFVRDKDLLLVLDNCEHLIDACAEFAEAFLSATGSSVVLATSRESLDVDGERTVRVPPLASGDIDGPAVQLFMRRARAVNSPDAVDAFDVETVAELCRRLDGLPLAIELAAARSTVLSPVELLEGITDRFALLHGGRRRQRQRVLESTLDWSYHLLDPDEQRGFRALGVFASTFGLDAAASVMDLPASATTDLLESLVAKSLVDRVVIEGASRFRLFETTSAYAEQQLAAADESAVVRDRHLEHFVRAAAPFRFEVIWDTDAIPVLTRDRADVVAAAEWATSQRRHDDGVRLVLGAAAVLCDDGIEAVRLIDRMIEQAGGSPATTALHGPRFWACVVGAAFTDAAASAVAQIRSPELERRCCGNLQLGWLLSTFDPEKAERHFEAAKKLIPQLADDATVHSVGVAFDSILSEALLSVGDVDGSLAATRRVLEHEPVGPNGEFVANAGRMAVACHLLQDRPDEGLRVAARFDRFPSRFGDLSPHTALCLVELGDLDAARRLIRDQAQRSVTGRIRLEAGTVLLLLAALAAAEHAPETASHLVLVTAYRRTTELIHLSTRIAERIGVADDYGRLTADERELIADRNWAEQRHLESIAAVRNEMVRRHWTD